MDGNGGIKWTGIRHFVRLKQTLQHWQAVTVNPKSQASNKNQSQSQNHNRGILSPAINKRLMNAMCCDSDEESCQSPEHLSDVPKGYLAVYVGPELRRFIIPTSYLSHLVFKVLLEKAEEEYGFDHSGGLTLPCEIETFKYLLKYMEVQQLDDHPDEQTPAESSLSKEG